MPGFNIVGAGGGDGPSNTIEIKRKHRWVFRTMGPITPEALLILQSASRPSFKFEEPEMHHDQEVVYFAGKQSWDPITLVWYDSQQDPDVSGELYDWLLSVSLFDAPLGPIVFHPSGYKHDAELNLTDGAGIDIETWGMYGCWPSAVNFQELDYSSTDLMTCEATLRYDRAVKTT
jgi:hypothetical protein